jgi:hypothetical protein
MRHSTTPKCNPQTTQDNALKASLATRNIDSGRRPAGSGSECNVTPTPCEPNTSFATADGRQPVQASETTLRQQFPTLNGRLAVPLPPAATRQSRQSSFPRARHYAGSPRSHRCVGRAHRATSSGRVHTARRRRLTLRWRLLTPLPHSPHSLLHTQLRPRRVARPHFQCRTR